VVLGGEGDGIDTLSTYQYWTKFLVIWTTLLVYGYSLSIALAYFVSFVDILVLIFKHLAIFFEFIYLKAWFVYMA
jgi:hypothetical protein